MALEFFNNSVVIRNSDKIKTREVDKNQKVFHFLHFIFEILPLFRSEILSAQCTEVRFVSFLSGGLNMIISQGLKSI